MADDSSPSNKKPDFRDSLGRFIIPPFVNDPGKRNEKWGLPKDDNEPGDYIIELNLLYEGGLEVANVKFRELYKTVLGEGNRAAVGRAHFQELLQVPDQRQ